MSRPALRYAFLIALVAGFTGAAVLRGALADDPTVATEAEQARIKQLVENLGSDDFRIREAASKGLVEFGAKARPALTEALKSESAEVRFRADQLLRRLDGKNRERPIDDGAVPTAPRPPSTPPAPGLGGFGWGGTWPQGGDAQKLIEEMEKRFADLEKRLNEQFGGLNGFGGFGNGQNGGTRFGGFNRPLLSMVQRKRHFVADGAELWATPRGATLTLTEKPADGVKTVSTYEGKSLDDILAAHPEIKDKPGVASLVDQVAEAKKHETEAKPLSPAFPAPGFTFSMNSQGVQVESTPGHVKVTVTEKGEDGKETTKVYEGTDLETLKKEHPELEGKVGGIQLHVLPGTGFGGQWKGLQPIPEPEDGDDDGDDDGGMAGDETGPFGLQIAPVDEALRAQLGVESGVGVVVRVVRAHSQADEIGLKANDVLTAVNGKPVSGPDAVADVLRTVKKGTPVSIDVLRDGKPVKLSR
jgi:hypothetical protein